VRPAQASGRTRVTGEMTAPKSTGGAGAAARAAAGPRTVLVTGVSRGLGRALALELARRGHSVVGCGRSAEHVRSLEAEIALPSRHFLTVADVVSF
jgi:NAD(P)-dependent dehydrogenase (short-subunit alcohol dehydrogenase family)